MRTLDTFRWLYARVALPAWRMLHALLSVLALVALTSCAALGLASPTELDARRAAIANEAAQAATRMAMIAIFGTPEPQLRQLHEPPPAPDTMWRDVSMALAATGVAGAAAHAGARSASGGRRSYDPAERPQRG